MLIKTKNNSKNVAKQKIMLKTVDFFKNIARNRKCSKNVAKNKSFFKNVAKSSRVS